MAGIGDDQTDIFSRGQVPMSADALVFYETIVHTNTQNATAGLHGMAGVGA